MTKERVFSGISEEKSKQKEKYVAGATLTCSCNKELHQNATVSKIGLGPLVALVTRSETRFPGVAVTILLTKDRRPNPAPFSLITTDPPAGVYQIAVATMGVGTGKKSTLISDSME